MAAHPEGDTASTEGVQRIKRYIDARREHERAIARLQAAEIETHVAQTELGRFLMPDDAKPGEAFGIWYRGALLTVAVHTVGDDQVGTTFTVSVRQREKNVEPGL